MKFLTLTIIALLANSTLSLAATGQCGNYAKYLAVRSYMGQVEADRDALSVDAKFQGEKKGAESYLVSIESPCVVDGDDSNCNMDFGVIVKSINGTCSKVSITGIR